jgi:hypothetical protein
MLTLCQQRIIMPGRYGENQTANNKVTFHYILKLVLRMAKMAHYSCVCG